MSSPFSMIMPQYSSYLFAFYGATLYTTFMVMLSRWCTPGESMKMLTKFLPNWVSLVTSGGLLLGSLIMFMMISLVPFGVMGLHLPLLGIGVSGSAWVTFTCLSLWYRSYQYKKMLLSSSSVSGSWVVMAIFIETISRVARGITLGARISVNIMMGSILHCVVGLSGVGWGLMGLCVFELGVVIIQAYVLMMLIIIYSQELH